MTTAIEIRDMSVGWAEQGLMSALELNLAIGESLVLVGPGGSGKSTTLRVIEQIVRGVDASAIEGLWWRGSASAGVDSCARMRQHGEFRREPVAELLAERGLIEREDQWMPPGEPERAQLRAIYDQPLGETPEPLRRFLSFALVAQDDAPLLLFDEPCFGLRGAWFDTVLARLRVLKQRRQTMVVVTHYLPLARAVADHVMLIVDGEIIESARVTDFFEHARHPRTRQYLQWGA